jgi:outer membrane protein assembly factor BamB
MRVAFGVLGLVAAAALVVVAAVVVVGTGEAGEAPHPVVEHPAQDAPPPPEMPSGEEPAREAGEVLPEEPEASEQPEEPGEEASGFHGEPVGGDTVTGLLQFRGNPTRTWYGLGPLPEDPSVAWRYPGRAMCSTEGTGEAERDWCGIGWTGQPLVWERDDGITEVVVGAYDGAVHFLDAETGEPTRPPFQTGFMVKGTETLDPDGYPLVYVGSRDGYFRVIALDRDVPTELWRLGRHPQGRWNNDWDANPSMVDDVLHIGGEDSWYRAVRLHRTYDDDGLVQIEPEILVEVPAWTDELLEKIGDGSVSIESSPAVTEDRVYWVNSGGRLVGLDRAAVERGEVDIVLDYWVGDDADASIVVDRDGYLYVTVELERFLPRAEELGQFVKLDNYEPEDPYLWGIAIPPHEEIPGDDGGAWATPALYGDHLYLPTHAGDLLVIDRHDGEVVYRERIGYHEWSSPAVVEDDAGHPWLLVGMCNTPGLRAYDLADPTEPQEVWTVPLAGCIESTPAVWKGSIYVGSRDGFLYAVR